jgi:hypothetical protein
MQYLRFTGFFILSHFIAYTIAGMIAYRFSKDLYEGENRLLDFMKDMSDEKENAEVAKLSMPAQILRGFLLAIVFLPILGSLESVSFINRAIFFAGLMFIYTDLASAMPFPDTIEGYVYMKKKYLQGSAFWKMQIEMTIYSVIFGLLASWLAF